MKTFVSTVMVTCNFEDITTDARFSNNRFHGYKEVLVIRLVWISRPIPRTLHKSSTDARAIASSEPNLQTSCLPMSSAFTPRDPVLTRMVTNSAGLSAAALRR
jgi:hypothetical protein